MKKKILAAGDAMLDLWLSGSVGRLSPGSQAPVFLESGEICRRPGGAADTAVNLAAAGAQTVLCAELGDDPEGEALLRLLREEGVDTAGVAVRPGGVTIRKKRYVPASGRPILRADREETAEPDEGREKARLETIRRALEGCALVVLSDYRKGYLSDRLIAQILSLAKEKKIPVFADALGSDPTRYRGAAPLKPNRAALGALTGMPVGTAYEAAKAAAQLCRLAGCRYVLATLDADGMLLADPHGLVCAAGSAAPFVRDTTGAGDTALAFFAVSFAEGKTPEECLAAACRAAAVQAAFPGTCRIPREAAEAASRWAETADEAPELPPLLARLRAAGKRIVFTNGCFDILHAGHVYCLQKARQMGDFLIVGLNGDASVRRLKGEGRPFFPLADREAVLSALACVDLVIPFDEDTPQRLIETIRPDVLVKGGDYTEAEIVGSAFVRAYGGEVRIVPLLAGRSTTSAAAKLFRNSETQQTQ